MAGPGWSSTARCVMSMRLAAPKSACRRWATAPLKTEKLGMGQRDVPIAMGGVAIAPGDYLRRQQRVIVSKTGLL